MLINKSPPPTRSENPSGKRSILQRGAALAKPLAIALLLTPAPAAFAQHEHTLPLVLSANSTQPGFVRIINRSDRAGTVTIHAIDDSGQRFGPVSLSIEAMATRNFDSRDLERGNPSKGLSRGVGEDDGNWRLVLDTELDIEPLAYIRTSDGFVTSVHDVAQGASMHWHVPFFNPASNTRQRSRLRLINTAGIDTEVVIDGLDDRGESPPEGEVRLTLPADAARMISAQELEAGADGFSGRFGDGAGKWQLFVSAGRPIQAMSLLATPTGHLSNLSTVTGDDIIRGGPGADTLYGGNGNDVLNPGDDRGSHDAWDVVHGSAGDDRIVYTDSGERAFQELDYSELDTDGITATIDGAANRATVDKGSAGTDTIADIANPLDAGGSPPYEGGFELVGTRFGDVFHLTLDEGQWMNVGGNAGPDTFNIQGNGAVRIDYEHAPEGIVIDLRTGTARNDGFGDVDTIEGDVWGVAGSEHSDVIRGSGNNERFIARAGDDVIDGGDGFDRLQFGYDDRFAPYLDVRNLDVDLGAGTATGTWNGRPFSYTISNIEHVSGGSGNDTLRGSDRGDTLYGGDGDDTLNPGDADGNNDEYDEIEGSAGNDRIVFTEQSPPTWTGVHYRGLDSGITATIDGIANHATIDKGSAGTDTVVDVANPMNSWALALTGTSSDDVFHVTVGDGQRLQLLGGAGNDTFNIQSTGVVRIQYNDAPRGIDVDLEAGRVNNDGFGDVDTIRGYVREVRCTEFADVIRGSDNDEVFKCLRGDDTIDGGGGFDRLRFDRFGGARNLFVAMKDEEDEREEGIATGSWNSKAFSYTFSNIEHVIGGPGIDLLVGGDGDDTLEGRGAPDLFLVGKRENDTIVDFDGEDDVIFLPEKLVEDFGLTHADVIAAARQEPDGVLIDLSSYGMGTVFLKNFHTDWLRSGIIRL